MDFTTINYVSLVYLLPRLAQEQRKNVQALERGLPTLADAEARGLVQEILTMKRRHLAILEKLASNQPEAVAV